MKKIGKIREGKIPWTFAVLADTPFCCACAFFMFFQDATGFGGARVHQVGEGR